MDHLKTKKSAQYQELKNRIFTQIQKNYIDSSAKANTGQLKFFKGLLTGNLAVAIKKRLRKERRFLHYLEENILEDASETISFFDKEKNWEAFLSSPYCPSPEIYNTAFNEADFQMPRFLLIQKAEKNMEKEFLYYYHYADNRNLTDDSKSSKKDDAYINLLFSTAFYEICLYEFAKILPRLPEPDTSMQESQTSGSPFPQIFSDDLPKDREESLKLLDFLITDYKKIQLKALIMFFHNYFIMQTMNLYAMLRMIAIIEYVGLHATDPEAGDADSHAPEGLAQTEANFWKKLQENWENQGTRSLFTYAIITNHLEAYCKKFTSMYQKYNISVHLHPDLKPPYTEDFYRCEADMHCYIKILEKRSRFFQRLIWNKTSSCQADYKNQPDESIKTEFEQLENELLDAAGQFAAPIVFATKAIMDLK